MLLFYISHLNILNTELTSENSTLRKLLSIFESSSAMAEKQSDSVSFHDIQKSYPPGENLSITYQLLPSANSASCDWIGLFQVGWTSSREYYTFEWTPTPLDNKGTVTFAGRRLPPDDTHFYQVCYVSANGRVIGASPPFQFSSASITKYNLDDFELVEVTEDSLMVLQSRGNQGKLEKEVTLFKESVSNLEGENIELKEKLQQRESQIKEKNEAIANMQKTLEAQTESEKRWIQKLEMQRAENYELMAAKSDEDQELAILVQKVSLKDKELEQCQHECNALHVECEDLKAHLHIKDSQVEDLTQLASARGEEKEQMSIELNHLREEYLTASAKLTELFEKYDYTTLEKEQYAAFLDEAKGEVKRHEETVVELQQELNVARENISELIGAGQNGLVIERMSTRPEPPTAPGAPVGMVDQSVYEALYDAFTNIQKYYSDSQNENQVLVAKLQQQQIKSDELLARVEHCRVQYEEVAQKNVELKKQLQSGAANKDHEEQVDELIKTCDTAVTELTARKLELKQRDATIAELQQKLSHVEQELGIFQDRHDTDVHQRTEALDIIKASLERKVQELRDLQTENVRLVQANQQLKASQERLKTLPPTVDRACPICNTKFPGRMTQQDFENHVEGHFQQ